MLATGQFNNLLPSDTVLLLVGMPAGVSAPAAPSPSELGWTGSLPHPSQFTAGADATLLNEQAKEVRTDTVAQGTGNAFVQGMG